MRSALPLLLAAAIACSAGGDGQGRPSLTPPHRWSPTVPSRSPATDLGQCDGGPAELRADIDGDGQPDIARHYADTAGAIVFAVCRTSGPILRISDLGGTGELFGVIDVEPDGVFELYGGSTSSTSGRANVYQFQVSRLTPVTEFQYGVLELAGGQPVRMAAWECVNETGDARRELVQSTIDYRAKTYTREAFAPALGRWKSVGRTESDIPAALRDPSAVQAFGDC